MRLMELSEPISGTIYINPDAIDVIVPMDHVRDLPRSKLIMRSGFEVVLQEDADELAERVAPWAGNPGD